MCVRGVNLRGTAVLYEVAFTCSPCSYMHCSQGSSPGPDQMLSSSTSWISAIQRFIQQLQGHSNLTITPLHNPMTSTSFTQSQLQPQSHLTKTQTQHHKLTISVPNSAFHSVLNTVKQWVTRNLRSYLRKSQLLSRTPSHSQLPGYWALVQC